MFVLIVGGGRTGTHLAALLVVQKHRVRLIEHQHEVLARIHRELPTEVIYEGEYVEVSTPWSRKRSRRAPKRWASPSKTWPCPTNV